MKQKMVMKNQFLCVDVEHQWIDNLVDKDDLVYPNQPSEKATSFCTFTSFKWKEKNGGTQPSKVSS